MSPSDSDSDRPDDSRPDDSRPDDSRPDDSRPDDSRPDDRAVDIGDAIPLDVCPGCDGRDFLVESNPEVVFRCLGCSAAWRVHLGFVWAADAPAPDGVTPDGVSRP